MIDNIAIGLTHLLLAIAAWRLLRRADLDRDPPPETLADVASPAPAPKRGARQRGV